MNAVLKLAAFPVRNWSKAVKTNKNKGKKKPSQKGFIAKPDFRYEIEIQRLRNTPFL